MFKIGNDYSGTIWNVAISGRDGITNELKVILFPGSSTK